MAKRRVIVKLSTKSGRVYSLDNPPDNEHQENFLVKTIVFHRDGLKSINTGMSDGANYIIQMESPLNGEKVYKFIPYNRIEDLLFVEIETDTKDAPAEELKRVD